MGKKKKDKKKFIKNPVQKDEEEGWHNVHYDADGHFRGTINLTKLWKKIKKFFKKLWYRIVWFFNKKSKLVPKKYKKRFIGELIIKAGFDPA